MPEWYTEGLISDIGYGDHPMVESFVRDAYLNKRFKNINALIGSQARYAGHSLWSFIADTYGEKVLKNVVYMAIVNRNIESGFLYILGKDLNDIEEDWKKYLEQKYGLHEAVENYPEDELVKAKKGERITHMATSGDGRYMAYVRQRFSRYKLYIHDLERDKKKRILTDGTRIAQNADYSYPLLSWHPNGKILAVITEEEGFTYLNFYNRERRMGAQEVL
ncbi:MAG: hypothetical protein U5L96_18885 [Owenweeksia sp.]|nr:hypothetical protein [Owenweeksia sp.]